MKFDILFLKFDGSGDEDKITLNLADGAAIEVIQVTDENHSDYKNEVEADESTDNGLGQFYQMKLKQVNYFAPTQCYEPEPGERFADEHPVDSFDADSKTWELGQAPQGWSEDYWKLVDEAQAILNSHRRAYGK